MVIIFDVDGTLVESVKAHAAAWQQVFREFGFDIPFDRIRFQIGKGPMNC
jgi:beta-phosphoglucomutase-like phosphatase (HAD superfamily)